MATRELIFDIFALDRASATLSRIGAAAEGAGTRAEKGAKVMRDALLGAGVVAVGLGLKSVEMASNFDAAILRLETTAGESPKALGMVSKSLLDMAGKVGYTAQELAVGMYTVESAGFHGANGLAVMAAAAKGARVEGADLTTVTDAVTSLLVDYHLKGTDAARVTNILTAAVGHGKTTFEQMAGALPNVAAAGATARISMSELAGAIATMTMHGTDASKAGTYLRQVIGQLEAPSAKARKVMEGLGIDANKLGLTLSSGSGHGLADAIKMVDDGITRHLQPSGLVAIETFKKSKGSASDYQKMLANLPPAFTTTFGALTQMVGGVKSLQGFLQLGGENLKTYKANVDAINRTVRQGGSDVVGFAQQQKTLNGKWNDAKGAASALAVEIGQKLTPYAESALDKFRQFAGFLSQHQDVVIQVGAAVTALAVAFAAVKVGVMAYNVVATVWMAATKAMTAAQWLLNLALDANPIGIVIVAIAALTAGIVYAYQHCETFRNIVTVSFNAIATVGRWLWNSVLGPVIRFLINGFATVTSWIGDMLDALSHIPGFGWAKTAADKMHGAAAAAARLSSNIKDIPDYKQVNVDVIARLRGSQLAINQLTNQAGNKVSSMAGVFPGHAAGGRNLAAGWSMVGELGPELMYVPGGANIYSNRESVAMMSRAGGTVTLQPLNISIDGNKIVQVLLQVKKNKGGVELGIA